MVGDPLAGGSCLRFCGPSCQVGEACLPLSSDIVLGSVGRVVCSLLCHAVCHFVAFGSRVCQDPPDLDLVVVSDQPGGYLDDGSGPVLARAWKRSCVCFLLFTIPLHAARRAIAAALPLPLRTAAIFSPPFKWPDSYP